MKYFDKALQTYVDEDPPDYTKAASNPLLEADLFIPEIESEPENETIYDIANMSEEEMLKALIDEEEGEA